MNAYFQIGFNLLSLIEKLEELESDAHIEHNDSSKLNVGIAKSMALIIADIWRNSPDFKAYRAG